MVLKNKPSAKIKRRYILFEGATRSSVENVILKYLGILGWAEASPVFTEIRGGKGRVVLSVDRKKLEDIRAAFEISESKTKIVRVSGTIKGLKIV